MRLAIDMAREGISQGQSPFGCAIARDGQVLACRHNTVLATLDITAHAEVNALRTACLVAHSVHLPGATVASTCEPCPMCMAALHWAQVQQVYFGASIADAQEAGFNELQVPARELLRQGKSRVTLVDGVLSHECRALFEEWLRRPDCTSY
jgi:tRNA(Arg) A34 adenosine deaminase TadA